jgi:DNA-binding response OmpR family regulator
VGVGKDPSHDRSAALGDGESPDVIVAEDDNLTALLTTEVLRRAGFSVVRASDGEAALEEVERLHPKVMVLDINMPRRDGLEVLRIVRRNLESAQLRILVLSSHAQADVADRARREGADDYLVKPYAPADLVARVRRLSDAGRDG